MAQELDDGEFWLPPEFLTDDDLLTDFTAERFRTKRSADFYSGFGDSFCFNSDLISPVESVVGSTETDSDEDDFIVGLTQKMANTTFQDFNMCSDFIAKGLKLSRSPQSTLFGCRPWASRETPSSVSRVSSPPGPKNVVGWDLIHAAAEEVARMRLIEETTAFYTNKLFVQPQKSSPAAVPHANPNPSMFFPDQTSAQSHISNQQLQAARFLQLKQQQQMMMKNVRGEGNMGYHFQNGNRYGGAGRTHGLCTDAWPTLRQSQQQQQQPSGTVMRPAFRGETGAKKERTGTGVFIPRRFANNPTETRQKPADCSKSDRLVHNLNLNANAFNAHPHSRGNGNFSHTADYEAAWKHHNRNYALVAQQRRSLPPQTVMNSQELRLPQEWTY